MFANDQGVTALRDIRRELQDNAGDKFPGDVMKELLLMYDVCESLELSYFQAQQVLGETGLNAVNQFINGPAFDQINMEKAQKALK